MAALMSGRLAFALAWLLLADGPARADAVDAWRGEIAAASARFGIAATWIEGVMRAESAGRTRWQGRPITSSAGAMGLMQLMPGTWAEMRALHGLGSDPHDPHDNIVGGAAYLAAMHVRFGYPGLFGAYHAGPARYAQFVRSGRPLPPETIAYMAAITASLGAPVPLQPPIFVLRADAAHVSAGEGDAREENRRKEEGTSDPLFALRRRF